MKSVFNIKFNSFFSFAVTTLTVTSLTMTSLPLLSNDASAQSKSKSNSSVSDGAVLSERVVSNELLLQLKQLRVIRKLEEEARARVANQQNSASVAPAPTPAPAPAPAPVAAPQPAPQIQIRNPNRITCAASGDEIKEATRILLNNFRSSGGTCGGRSIPSTGSVKLNSTLSSVARGHSDNMSIFNFFSHSDQNGNTVSSRATAAGYDWRAIGENIAGGYSNLTQVFNGWKGSTSHCENMLKGVYVDFGISCVQSSSASTRFDSYWTLVLGTPLN